MSCLHSAARRRRRLGGTAEQFRLLVGARDRLLTALGTSAPAPSRRTMRRRECTSSIASTGTVRSIASARARGTSPHLKCYQRDRPRAAAILTSLENEKARAVAGHVL